MSCTMIRTAETHDLHSRLMYTVLDLYPNDGGQYTFAQNLIEKYGFMFKSSYSRSPAANVTRVSTTSSVTWSRAPFWKFGSVQCSKGQTPPVS